MYREILFLVSQKTLDSDFHEKDNTFVWQLVREFSRSDALKIEYLMVVYNFCLHGYLKKANVSFKLIQ